MNRTTLAATLSASILALSAPVALSAPDTGDQGAGPRHHAGAMSQKDVDAQMHRMQQMHEQMMNAKSPEERAKLMTQHRETMHQGMAMMRDMGDTKGVPRDRRMQMMENRMNMMDMMMQMMMDRQDMMGDMDGGGMGMHDNR